MNWKRLSKGLGVVWLASCALLTAIVFAFRTNPDSNLVLALILAAGVVGYAVAFVISASFKEER